MNKKQFLLLAKIEHELNILLSCHYIHSQYNNLNYLTDLRFKLLDLIKSNEVKL